ncbi:MAG: phosphate signaling complex protein PhoU [Bacteroidetes bacterium]|nr:phosphate signaling complex protein PhoU [Bacteroidota bacterium]
MDRHFQRELESLKTTLIKMASIVEENFALALRAVNEKNTELTERVIETDKRIDQLEIEIDDAIIDLLALQQPVASDLRFILAALKINNDLERIGDHAVNIAEATDVLINYPDAIILEEIPQMANIARAMLKDALDSFIQEDPVKARAVLTRDDQIDDLNRQVARKIIENVKCDTKLAELELELARVSRNLERVADLTTNIAEEVIFYIQARIVKHHAEEKKTD